MAVTAVIVSWNSAPDLRLCLPTIPAEVPVIVVDNGSADDSIEVARAHGVRVIDVGANVGFAAAVNKALGAVETDNVALVNPDVTVGAGAFQRLEGVLQGFPDVGIAGPNTRLPNGRPEPPAARHDRTAKQILLESFGLVHLSRRLDLQMVQARDQDRDVDAVNGAFLVTRTELLRDLGGLDEDVFMYLEDQELCRRVRDEGYRVRFVADAHAVHGNGTSTARATSDQRARAYLHRIDADLEFLRRHGRRGEVGCAIVGFLLRSLIGLGVALVRPERRLRYWWSFWFTVRQFSGRVPAPPV